MSPRTGSHNLARLAERALERRGDYPALLFEGTWHSSMALHEQATRLAGGLAAFGAKPGDRVVVLARNCPEVLVAYHAAWRAGATIVPTSFMLSPSEVEHVLRDCRPRIVLIEPDSVAKVCQAARRIRHPITLVALGGPEQPGILPLDRLLDADPRPLVPRADDDLAALVYTGGTTGRSKGVMLSHANLWHAGHSRYQVGYAPVVDRTLVTLPLSHTFGALVTVGDLHWPVRRATALLRWFSAQAFLQVVEEASISDATLVPAMLQALLAEQLEQRDLSSLRSIVSGSAPLPAKVASQLRERLPWVELREGYGLTEASGLVAATPRAGVRPGSVGRPAPGTEVEIRDESGAALGPGQKGEICCRSRFIMLGYWRSPDATAEVVRDGWLYTGDIGFLDADGYLFIVDRKKDLIIRGGFNVHPRDVEEKLIEHEDVAEASIVGRPDEARGEEVVAFVVPRAGARIAPEVLVGWCREHIGGYRYPREVHVVAELPRTRMGKIDRKRLRAQLGG